jgi:hypothetical protein
MLQCFDEVFIVVDALDECGKYVTEVTKRLASFTRPEVSKVSTLLLSRNEHEINAVLSRTFTTLDIKAQSEDLKRYVDVEVQRRTEDGALEFNNPSLMEEIREKLVAKADGM